MIEHEIAKSYWPIFNVHIQPYDKSFDLDDPNYSYQVYQKIKYTSPVVEFVFIRPVAVVTIPSEFIEPEEPPHCEFNFRNFNQEDGTYYFED